MGLTMYTTGAGNKYEVKDAGGVVRWQSQYFPDTTTRDAWWASVQQFAVYLRDNPGQQGAWSPFEITTGYSGGAYKGCKADRTLGMQNQLDAGTTALWLRKERWPNANSDDWSTLIELLKSKFNAMANVA